MLSGCSLNMRSRKAEFLLRRTVRRVIKSFCGPVPFLLQWNHFCFSLFSFLFWLLGFSSVLFSILFFLPTKINSFSKSVPAWQHLLKAVLATQCSSSVQASALLLRPVGLLFLALLLGLQKGPLPFQVLICILPEEVRFVGFSCGG